MGPRGETKGPFASLFDFCARVDRTRLNKRTLEALIKAGAFDAIEMNRASLVASIDRAFDFANSLIANANQGGLFDMMGDDSHGSSTQDPALVEMLPWGVKERLTQEKTAVGFYLSGHLFDEVEKEVRRFIRTPIEELADSREPQIMAGIVSDFRVINGQRGRLALFKLDDKSAMIEASADENVINAHRDLLKEDEFVVLLGRLQLDHFSGGLRVKVMQAWDLASARAKFGRYLQVAVATARRTCSAWCANSPRSARKHPRARCWCTACACAWACAAAPRGRRPWPNCNSGKAAGSSPRTRPWRPGARRPAAGW